MDIGPDIASRELFRSPHLRVRVVGRGRGHACVVTFNCFLEIPDLEGPDFGEAFFVDRGIDAVHVTCVDNRWYQYEDWPIALARIRDAVRPYGRVISYGSSMGGYAAIRYGGSAGADEALAISPQFSIDVRRVPFERRWRRPAAGIVFLHEDGPITIGRATVVYDPRNADARHVDLFAEALPVRRIRLCHAGHPAGAYLAETGLLADLVLGICDGCLDPDYERRARAVRRRSGQYLFTLARRTSAHRIATTSALARLAVEAAPREPVYHSYLALRLAAGGDEAAAEETHRRAVALAPASPLFLGRLARFLVRRGRVAEGAKVASLMLALTPKHDSAVHLQAFVLLMRREPAAAAHLVWDARAGWRLLAGLLWDRVVCAGWRPTGDGWRRRWWSTRRDRLPLCLGEADAFQSRK